MALFYTERKQGKTPKKLTLQITDLDYQGLGVARLQGKTWFVENALPQETVEVRVLDEKKQYGHAVAQKILQHSEQRIEPKCDHYAECGGCQLQHIPITLQQQVKQQALQQRLSRLQPTIAFQPLLSADEWGYRRRLRLSILFDKKSQTLSLGLRRRRSKSIVNIQHCAVAEPHLNAVLAALQTWLPQWQSKAQLGHIELVAADNGVAMLLRHAGQVQADDKVRLLQFAAEQQLQLFVCEQEYQIQHWYGDTPYYQLANGQRLAFAVRDFIQVNRTLNQKMIDTALDWLALSPNDRVLDLFCGMGNFTLPLASKVASAVGIEGVAEMVAQAKQNALVNGVTNVEFYQTDLDRTFSDQPWVKQAFDKVLLDPPRSGALFALPHICELRPNSILYVSCNPATLVRDSEYLLQQGYQIEKSAAIDMFPHTAHLESITLFKKR
ncbi:23S rRNA (uracil(1939)-C(5))-methyltransferase RlmD [Testudinibacter sp. TR-2022]|uniref:23S rRNA (uracil(1939)-C(5))-methyltransferase RlmD n=1 Tax=Testudinibacter sp. TR-2022 TaxID=2585029 RepID=UPI001119DE8D|nr:23S rRNA (uracil(1939)-C(5))-methyltransferase RlmD [Testudinibacter sp. TR-2022]TNH05569.1 23S rRNA (uracil(1939)-C(5))-methyltransferase RlmD [Pasteurellaceae bacterium Phil11]TNH20416.1 23S rRNA (uracil(1939)-C(5))-methyltransferase RlmD [Testudinibacter sp. TR-2022]TNH24607.1 23S rRNA (uracil(1939)-C(5))-methyltransferase RlmD [Testudinibacter sp. TR-2022]